MTVTVAPGTERSCWSFTMPRMAPVWTPWASAVPAEISDV